MTRQELKTALIQAGIYHPPYRKEHPLWKQALEDYKLSTGDDQVSLSCGSCILKIKNWLERG
jgi:hypothetical protein